jgi:hypothetical protein
MSQFLHIELRVVNNIVKIDANVPFLILPLEWRMKELP